MDLPSFNAVESQLMPSVIAALLLDSAIIAIWYMLGYVLNNPAIKGGAKAEMYQFVGTAILAAILASIFLMYSGGFIAFLSGTSLAPATISSLCSSITASTPLQFIDSNSLIMAGSANYITGNKGSASATSSFPGMCNVVSSVSSSSVDYPLAAAGVIIANLTNQTAANLNRLFVFDSYIGYLSKVSPTLSFCMQSSPNWVGPCMLPPMEVLPGFASAVLININASYTPFAGYSMVYQGLAPLTTLFPMALESFITQLAGISILLYIWPFLLFLGLVLRALPFTRKIGGLLIAVAVGVIIIYPFIFSIEYLSMSKGTIASANAPNSIYGFNSLDTMTVLPAAPCTTISSTAATANTLTVLGGNIFLGNMECSLYNPNFFVEPNISAIAKLNGCWPPGGNKYGAFTAITEDSAYLLIPVFANFLVSFLVNQGYSMNAFQSTFQNIYLPAKCEPNAAENTSFMMANAYGMVGIVTYWLPILNIIITLISIIGLSGLLGGDTNLAGISKLI